MNWLITPSIEERGRQLSVDRTKGGRGKDELFLSEIIVTKSVGWVGGDGGDLEGEKYGPEDRIYSIRHK